MQRHVRVLGCVAVATLCTSAPGRLDAQQQPPPIFACVVPRSGTLYLAGQGGASATCRSAEHTLVQWNTVGPAGAPGLPGAQGPADHRARPVPRDLQPVCRDRQGPRGPAAPRAMPVRLGQAAWRAWPVLPGRQEQRDPPDRWDRRARWGR